MQLFFSTTDVTEEETEDAKSLIFVKSSSFRQLERKTRKFAIHHMSVVFISSPQCKKGMLYKFVHLKKKKIDQFISKKIVLYHMWQDATDSVLTVECGILFDGRFAIFSFRDLWGKRRKQKRWKG